MKNKLLYSVLACASALVLATPQKAQAVIIDDFNVGLGHFNQTISFSGTTVGEDGANSSNTRVTTNSPVEGVGHAKLVLAHDATTTPFRLRHVSGGASPANNVQITTTSGTDGWIGYYLKTTATGWETSLNFDGPGNTAAEMAGSTSIPVIGDGQWHLYEWNLDSITDWVGVPGISTGPGGALPDRVNTIDSIYLRDLDGSPGPTAEIFFDFVAWNPSGSVSNLLADPCLSVPSTQARGPISTNSNQVTVVGIDAASTNITVYQDSGSGFVAIGSTNAGIVAGVNTLTINGLIKGAKVIATQTKNGQESCLLPDTGIFVGGGANPTVRLAYTIRETTLTGPVGADGTGNGNLHFLGASQVSGGAPVNAAIIVPTNEWQTISIGGKAKVASSANAAGALIAGNTYGGGFDVAIQVFAFKTVGETVIFSPAPAESSFVISNGSPFAVNWTWDAVPGAEGYRVLRDVGHFGFLEGTDVLTNSLLDTNAAIWGGTIETIPNYVWLSPWMQWNPSVGNTNGAATDWGILESLSFAIDSDTGPFDIYIDNLQNGSTVFQTFEEAVPGTTDYGFRAPSFSGTTSPNLLSTPNVGEVTDATADTGANSFNIKFQWSGTNATRWLRLTTSGVGNPMVNLDDPISFRMLLLPVGSVVEPPAQPPTIEHSLSGNQLTLTWTGTFNLQSKTNLSEATWTNVGVSNSPYVTTVSGSAKFFRLQTP